MLTGVSGRLPLQHAWKHSYSCVHCRAPTVSPRSCNRILIVLSYRHGHLPLCSAVALHASFASEIHRACSPSTKLAVHQAPPHLYASSEPAQAISRHSKSATHVAHDAATPPWPPRRPHRGQGATQLLSSSQRLFLLPHFALMLNSPLLLPLPCRMDWNGDLAFGFCSRDHHPRWQPLLLYLCHLLVAQCNLGEPLVPPNL